MYWFSISFYEFKAALHSPCNQSRQRSRKTYRCKVSPSPIKAASCETCKNDVNHHGWAHHQGEKQIHFSQCRKDQMDSSHSKKEIFTGWPTAKASWPNVFTRFAQTSILLQVLWKLNLQVGVTAQVQVMIQMAQLQISWPKEQLNWFHKARNFTDMWKVELCTSASWMCLCQVAILFCSSVGDSARRTDLILNIKKKGELIARICTV